jgi:aerobic-type carbon monoxide dehydrogenase small subunit (CoxS/CutS family)
MNLKINSKSTVVPDTQRGDLLVWVLRDTLGLVGTRYGCGAGVCGSCCQTTAGEVTGRKITTLEGLAEGTGSDLVLHPVQQAFLENPLQCCWCMSGHIINAVALLEKIPNPNATQIDEAMNENYCRCGGYNNIRKNVTRAAEIALERGRVSGGGA